MEVENYRTNGDEHHGTHLSKHPGHQADHQAAQVEEEQGHVEGIPGTAASCQGHGELAALQYRQCAGSVLTEIIPIKPQEY